MAFHVNEETGHEHMHLVWSRIDEDAMAAKPLPFFKLRLKEACRELEVEMGLTQVRNERGPDEPPAPNRDEIEEARRLGVDVKAIRQTIRDCFGQSDNGHSFVAALTEHDLMLAKGDRRDYVVIDYLGGMHALSKRLTGCTAAETRERLADLDREALPTVNTAREAMEFQTFNGLGKAAQEKLVELPSAELGRHPDVAWHMPTEREGHTTSEPGGAAIVGKAVAQVAIALGEVAAGTAEKSLDAIANVFSFGADAAPAPPPLQLAAMEPIKPKHDPQEDIARTLRTATRDTVADDPAARAGFATNPAAATPDIAQQIANRWRKLREERDLER